MPFAIEGPLEQVEQPIGGEALATEFLVEADPEHRPIQIRRNR